MIWWSGVVRGVVGVVVGRMVEGVVGGCGRVYGRSVVGRRG